MIVRINTCHSTLCIEFRIILTQIGSLRKYHTLDLTKEVQGLFTYRLSIDRSQ